jgi:hypothetical protein
MLAAGIQVKQGRACEYVCSAIWENRSIFAGVSARIPPTISPLTPAASNASRQTCNESVAEVPGLHAPASKPQFPRRIQRIRYAG